jgi:hypothetical protein
MDQCFYGHGHANWTPLVCKSKVSSLKTNKGERSLSRNTNKTQLCNRIYYPKVYWRLNMFRVAHRSPSAALNCICRLWFIDPCGDRPVGIINSITKLHLVGISTESSMLHRSMNIKGDRSKTYKGPNVQCLLLLYYFNQNSHVDEFEWWFQTRKFTKLHPVRVTWSTQIDRHIWQSCHLSHVKALNTNNSDHNCHNMLIGQVCDRRKLCTGRQTN